MKKKIWVMILTAVLLLNLLPGMTSEASAADDTSSLWVRTTCRKCRHSGNDFLVIGFTPTPISSIPDPELHWTFIRCANCGFEYPCVGSADDDGGIFKHTGGTETPTCTTGKTCELCGAQYGILGHIWSDWQSNGDNTHTHTRTCQREGCGETETGNCNSSTAHCGTYGTCAVCGGTYFHADHTFPARWDWRSDTDVGRDAEYHWVRCLYCTEGKTAKSTHWFSEGNMHLKSPATCVSKAVYYMNCGTCYYKGTETYEYKRGNIDPNNHTGNEEIRGAAEATCTTAGYTGDTYCKDCDALLSTGTVIPATGHVGGTATCKDSAVCKVCHKPYGEKDAANHVGGTEVRGKKDATCTAAGYTGDTYCKGCDAKLATGKAIPATGHTGGTATCKDSAVCKVCHKPYGEKDAANHVGGTEVRGKKDATCTAAGYTGDTYCKGCDAKLATGKAIPATGHTGGTATCKDLAACEVCHKPYGEKDSSNHAGGTEVRGKKDATCTAAGYTGDTYCKGCDAKLATGKAIPATGHTGGTATCYWKATCEVCGETYGGLATRNHIAGCEPEWIVTETDHEQKYSRCGRIAVLKGEHTFGDWTVTQEAAPGEAGEQERVCTVCGYAETEEIAALAAEESPGSAPVSAPEPEKSAEPIAEPSPEIPANGVVWWIVLVGVIAGIIIGIVVRRKKKK